MLKILALVLCFVASPSFAGYTAIYTQPKGNAEIGVAAQLRDSQTLEKIAAVLNRVVNVQRDIPIIGASCGQSNAFYSPEKKQVVLCYEFLTDNATKLVKKLGKQYSQEQLSSVLASELAFTLLHEVGHSLFDIYELPVLGREEDAADKFAAFVLLSTNGNRQLKEATLFFQLNKPTLLTRVFKSKEIYGDEHSLMQQRIANLVCWGFGKEPSDFNQIAASVGLPQNRLARCADEYTKLNRDIRSLLGNNLKIDQLNFMPVSSSSESSRAISRDMSSLATQHKCLSCHGIDNRIIGPAFREVSRKYRGSDSVQQLVLKVQHGSAGVWGAVPAPPMSSVPEDDIRSLVQWITSL